MFDRHFASNRQSVLALGLIVLFGTALSGCMSASEQKRVNLDEDTSTCDSFGARYGSREYSQCMIVQQERRDKKGLESLEQIRIMSEISRNNQKVADSMRKERCDRNPDRRECKK